MREIWKGSICEMIKCDRESGAIVDGNVMECLVEFGVLAECIIEGAPEDLRLHVAMNLTNMLKTAIERATKGGEKKRKV